MSNNYTADILFYLSLFLGLLLSIFSIISWDLARDAQLRLTDEEKSKQYRVYSTFLFAFALLSIGLAIFLYFYYPPHKILTKTIYEKPQQAKNVNVYIAPQPSRLESLKPRRVEAPTPKPRAVCPPQPQTQRYTFEMPCPGQCPSSECPVGTPATQPIVEFPSSPRRMPDRRAMF